MRGIPFATAHEITGALVSAARSWASVSPRSATRSWPPSIDRLTPEIKSCLTPEAAVAARNRLRRHGARSRSRAARSPGNEARRAAPLGSLLRRARAVEALVDDRARSFEIESADAYSIAHLKLVRRVFYGRWVAAILIVIAFALLINAFATGRSPGASSPSSSRRSHLAGLVNTIIMTVCAMVLGDRARRAVRGDGDVAQPVLYGVAQFYIWFFRGTPLLLQLLLWFNLALIFPTLGVPGLVRSATVDVISPFVATLLGLGINQGAYTAEVVRAGILSVDGGQTEGGEGDRDDASHAAAPDRAAAGDARDHPAGRQRGDQHGEAHLGGERHPVLRRSCAPRRRSITPTRA
jgi:His/Glu/Gln/Arg/opine family amino acid ABC transporter permease subunit